MQRTSKNKNKTKLIKQQNKNNGSKVGHSSSSYKFNSHIFCLGTRGKSTVQNTPLLLSFICEHMNPLMNSKDVTETQSRVHFYYIRCPSVMSLVYVVFLVTCLDSGDGDKHTAVLLAGEKQMVPESSICGTRSSVFLRKRHKEKK